MGKTAAESSKATLGGEPTPGRGQKNAPLEKYFQALKAASNEQPLEPLQFYWLQITPLIAM